jgi:hypothetical protein
LIFSLPPDKRLEKHLKAFELLNLPVANPMLPELLRGLEVTNWKKLLEQHKPWILWTQFLQLYQAVASGEISMQEGIRVLTNRAMQEFQQQQAVTPQPEEKQEPQREIRTKEVEEKTTGGEKAGTKKTKEREEIVRQ